MNFSTLPLEFLGQNQFWTSIGLCMQIKKKPLTKYTHSAGLSNDTTYMFFSTDYLGGSWKWG